MSIRLLMAVVMALTLVPFKAFSIEARIEKGSPVYASQSGESVVNIVLNRMDEDYLYATDGNKYPISQETKIIYNTHSVTKMRIAELHFKRGRLMTVIIK